jgi:hypothetical protein
LVGPPRKGCSVEFLYQLNEYQPASVEYMSCNPATQVRDAKLLLSFGYHISSILALFERKNGDVKILVKKVRLRALYMWHLVLASVNNVMKRSYLHTISYCIFTMHTNWHTQHETSMYTLLGLPTDKMGDATHKTLWVSSWARQGCPCQDFTCSLFTLIVGVVPGAGAGLGTKVGASC